VARDAGHLEQAARQMNGMTSAANSCLCSGRLAAAAG
jgi:hypothetical protein